ncbi:helix-turn-helix domain-containing protein [Spirillospora sp. NPDC049024]
MRGSTGGRPLTAALDLFGRRWTLRIIRELQDEPLGFRPLWQRCDAMSSSVLRQRLLELIDAGPVHQTPENLYALTGLGRDAREALGPRSRWSDRWAAALEEPPA